MWYDNLPTAQQVAIIVALIGLVGTIGGAFIGVMPELSRVTPTPTATPTSTVGVTPTYTASPSPKLTPTDTPTSTPTPTYTPTPTPDCQDVQIDYLELELNRDTTRKECPITLQRSDVEKLANLSGRAYLSGPGATQCRCTRCWMRMAAAEEVPMECSEECSFSIPISDQVHKIFMKLDLYGSVKLCTITIE
jgi:hypothetical protein